MSRTKVSWHPYKSGKTIPDYKDNLDGDDRYLVTLSNGTVTVDRFIRDKGGNERGFFSDFDDFIVAYGAIDECVWCCFDANDQEGITGNQKYLVGLRAIGEPTNVDTFVWYDDEDPPFGWFANFGDSVAIYADMPEPYMENHHA